MVLNRIYIIAKYVDFRQKMDNTHQFIYLFDKTNIAKNDFILSVQVYRSFFFNKSFPILNNSDTTSVYIETFRNLTNKFEELIFYTSKAK